MPGGSWLIENMHLFWGLGPFTIILLSVLAYSTVYGEVSDQGLSFLFAQARVIGTNTTSIFQVLFLLVAAGMLLLPRSEYLNHQAESFQKISFGRGQKNDAVVTGELVLLCALVSNCHRHFMYGIGLQEPRLLITLSAILNAAAMMVAFGPLHILNKRHILSPYQPSLLRNVLLLTASVIFAGFLIKTIVDQFAMM